MPPGRGQISTKISFPDCDLTSPLQNGECGPSSIDSFGQARTVRNWDQDALSGFGVREYNWQGSVSVSHELYPGWGVEVAWFRTSFGNLITTDNLVVGPGDYSEYCVDESDGSAAAGRRAGPRNLWVV